MRDHRLVLHSQQEAKPTEEGDALEADDGVHGGGLGGEGWEGKGGRKGNISDGPRGSKKREAIGKKRLIDVEGLNWSFNLL